MIGLIVLVMFVCGLQGCAGGEGSGPSPRRNLNREIKGLENGASISAVIGRLGEPASEYVESKQRASLFYPGWQLDFEDGGLFRRTHELERLRPGVVQGGGPGTARILALKRGMRLAKIKAKLGTPDVYEVVYEAEHIPEQVLRYGPWELRFERSRLRMRTKW